MKVGKKYLYQNKQVYFRGKWNENSELSGLYVSSKNVLFYYSKLTKKKYRVNKNSILINKKKDEIVKEILENQDKIVEGPVILTDKEKENIFLPEIHNDDDILVKNIKNILLEERIPIKELKSRFKSNMEFNNFKRSLLIRHTITIEGFSRWMEILDKEWEILIK